MRLLHIFGSAPDPGIVERASRVARVLGRDLQHLVDDAATLSAFDVPGATALSQPLPLGGGVSLPRYTQIANTIANVDLILTYGSSALDVLIARRIYGRRLPPVVHHAGPAAHLSVYDRLAWRLALPAAARVIGDGEIEDGVDLTGFAPGKPGAAIPGLDRQRGDFVVGCISTLRSGLGLSSLVRAVAAIPNAKLVVIGGGPGANSLAGEARRAGLASRLVLPGQVRDLARALRQFDLLAVPEGGVGQFTLLETMASGLPIVAPLGTDILPENGLYRDFDGLRGALLRFAGNGELRARVGEGNRGRAVARHDADKMRAAYRDIYAAAAIDIG